MTLTRQQFDSDPNIQNLPPQQQAQLRRRYYQQFVQPSIKGMSVQDRAPIIDQWTSNGPAQPALDVESNPFKAAGKAFVQEIQGGGTGSTMTGRIEQSLGVTENQSFPDTLVAQGPAAGAGEIAGRMAAQVADPASWLVGGAAGKLAGKVAATVPLVSKVAARAPRLVSGAAAGAAIGGGSEAVRQYNAGEADPFGMAEQTGVGALFGGGAGALADVAGAVPTSAVNPALGKAKALGFKPATANPTPADVPQFGGEAGALPTPPAPTHLYASGNGTPTPVAIVGHAAATDTTPAHLVLDDGTSRFKVPVGDQNLYPLDAVNTSNPLPAKPAPPARDYSTPAVQPPTREQQAGMGLDDRLEMIDALRRQNHPAPTTPAVAGEMVDPPQPFQIPPNRNQRLYSPQDLTDMIQGLQDNARRAAPTPITEPPAQPATPDGARPPRLVTGSQVPPSNPAGYNLDELLDMHEGLRRNAALDAQSPTVQQTVPQAPALAPMPPTGGARPPKLAGGKVSAPQQLNFLDQLGNLFGGEEGSASPEAAAGLPGTVLAGGARLAGGAVRAAMQPLGALNRGVDAALGTVADATGANRLGNRLADAAGHLIYEAGNNNTTPIPGTSATVGDALRAVRGFTQSDAGLPAGYADLRDVGAPAKADALLRPVLAKADELRGRLDSVSQEALHDAITNGHAGPEADAVRSLVDPVSQTLRDVGSLSDQQYQEWAGKYLPRLYEKYLNEMPAVAQMMRGASKILKGSQHRGKLATMDPEDLAALSRDWQATGATPDGKVTMEDPATGDQVDVPAQQVGDYAGQWKPLRTVGGKVVAWRDWTPDERMAMGEHKNVSDALDTLAQRSYRDLKNGLLIQDIANNPEWAVPATGPKPAPDWVHLGNEKVKGNDLPRWGALADHWVHPAIARDLQTSMVLQRGLDNIPVWSAIMGGFKRAKTILSPPFYLNNIMQNFPVLELAGGDATDFPQAVHEMASNSPLHQQASDLGLYRDSGLAREMAGRLNTAGLDSGNMLGMALKAAKQLEDHGTRFAQASDDAFKLALVMGKMRQGIPIEDAVKYANRTFYDSTRVNSPMARVLAGTTHPFIKPFLHYGAKLPELAARNPAKVAKLALYYAAGQRIANALNGETQDEANARDALAPGYLKGNMLRVGTDSNGMPRVVDTGNFGAANVFDTSDQTVAPPAVDIPGLTDLTGIKAGVPRALVPTGPAGTAYALTANYDSFRQKPIADRATPVSQQLRDTAAYLVKDLGPGVLASGQKLGSALTGTPDPGGRVYDVPTALANLLGVKAQPFDAQGAYAQLFRQTERQVKDHQAEVSKAAFDLQRGRITPEQFHQVAATQQDLITQALSDFRQRAQAAQPALRQAQPPRLVSGRQTAPATSPALDPRLQQAIQRGNAVPI